MSKKLGRPTLKTPELISKICEMVAEGHSMRKVCADLELTRSVILRWLTEDESFQDQYARSQQIFADIHFDQTLTIADEEYDGSSDPAVFNSRQRLRVDTRKWYLSKMFPKKYGDKMAVGGAEDLGPIRTITRDMNPEEAYALMMTGQGKLATGSTDPAEGLM